MDIAGKLFLERYKLDATMGVAFGICLFESTRDRAHLGLRLFSGDAPFEGILAFTATVSILTGILMGLVRGSDPRQSYYPRGRRTSDGSTELQVLEQSIGVISLNGLRPAVIENSLFNPHRSASSIKFFHCGYVSFVHTAAALLEPGPPPITVLSMRHKFRTRYDWLWLFASHLGSLIFGSHSLNKSLALAFLTSCISSVPCRRSAFGWVKLHLQIRVAYLVTLRNSRYRVGRET
jgi:hypothetical protein